ncbi:MAG TPA: hypothetical protein DIW80_02160 [Gordonia polyisoprenivorans]|nr:hypothetical protein [Gordonia polyisoprenivorans]
MQVSSSPLSIDPADRAVLERLIASGSTPQAHSTRARIVLTCTETTTAEAARRCGVTFATAAKWRRRFLDAGTDGLLDAARSGRPRTDSDTAREVLTCVLRDPPAGGWTTRAIARSTGASQSTVSRLRRTHFPDPGAALPAKFTDQTSILGYVHIDAQRSLLALYAPTVIPSERNAQPTLPPDLIESVEAMLCAPMTTIGGAVPTSGSDLDLVQRAIKAIPAGRRVTLITDFEPRPATATWVDHQPHVERATLPRAQWTTQLHSLVDGMDSRQLSELRDLRKRLRAWARAPMTEFVWTRSAQSFESVAQDALSVNRGEKRSWESTVVIHGLAPAIVDGTLQPGRRIGERTLAKRVPLPPSAVGDALQQLADDGLIHQDGLHHFFVPVPTERDVVETYTARGLLGTAIVRRLASRPDSLPRSVADILAELRRHARENRISESDSADLDMQDELAYAADMPRIATMFVRLTLQLRLFVPLMGVDYAYPIDGIVADNSRIVDAIRARDPEAAVAAWRRKIDNCARYMVLQAGGE